MDFAAIYREEVGFVWRYLRRLGISERHLEDVTHDVFEVVYRRREDFDPGRAIRPWLVGIAFRVASEHRRRGPQRREIPDANPEPKATTADVQGEQLDQQRRRALLAAALDQLDLDRRAVVVLHELEGYSIPEVSQMLGVGVNTLYSRLRLAREQLAKAIRRIRQQGATR